MTSYHKRVALCYFLIVATMFVCILRLCTIFVDPNYKTVAETASSKKISIGYSRGTIYDTFGTPLTNTKIVYCNLIFDKPTALIALYEHFSSKEMTEITDEIRKSGFSLRYTDQKLTADGIYSFAVTEHNRDDTLASHIIGYTNSVGRGVSGIEAAFDDLLSSDKENSITFTLSGIGNVLEGIEPTLSYDYKTECNGVRTTIDSSVQSIAEAAAKKIKRGAIVITEVETGKIRALVSRPSYDPENLADLLDDPDEPLLNRAFCTYNIGSVFKPYVAAAGYEGGVGYYTECKGYTDIDGLAFSCHNLGGHGDVDISSALKYSCNTFFYEYIGSVGGRRVINIARKAGFESSITLAKGMVCKAGSLGDTSVYDHSKRALANMSIGQGELMLSPLAITNLYMAIAGGGEYRTPSLIEGTVRDGSFTSNPIPARVRVMSEYTAAKLKNDLAAVLTKGGTGESAAPPLTTAAGKTGTAQTGIVKNGKKVTNSWFCGFFPLDKPKYAVTVLSENAEKGCGDVFAYIADQIIADIN